jgi:molybdopterin-guanine dinucleotide biosynthesis protein A
MGRDKAGIRIGDRSLADLQIAKLWLAGASEVLLSVRSRRGHVPRADCVVVPDNQPGCGPLGGLLSCLDRMKTDILLACAVDLPLVEAEGLSRLVSRASASRGIVYQNSDGWFEPLLAVYPRSITTLAKQQIADSRFSLQALLSAAVETGLMGVQPLPRSQRMRLMNINTPEDLARLLVRFPELRS